MKQEITNIIDIDNYEQLLFLGDIHGNFNVIINKVKQLKLNDSCIIQVGDFGIGFKPRQEYHKLTIINNKLKKLNTKLYVIRGNHDNPVFFDIKYNKVYSNIIFVEDYTILKVNVNNEEKNIFLCGGALSIDRKVRIEQEKYFNVKSYWPDEVFVYDENLISQVKNINIIVTHTAPECTEPYLINDLVKYYAKEDITLIDELNRERRQMSYMFDILYENNKETLEKYYYGHFHFSAINEYKNIIFHLLNIDEIK